MVHTVYKTTNQENRRFYIGIHKTEDPNDAYLGSGTIIKRVVQKHGASKFNKEVLFVFLTRKEAENKEVELLLEEKSNPLCYNLHEGGEGGFEYINKHYYHTKKKLFKKAEIVRLEKLRTDPAFQRLVSTRISEGLQRKFMANPELLETARKRILEMQPLAVAAWRGQKHTKEARKRMSVSHQGEKNNRFGTHWMYNDELLQSKPFFQSDVPIQQQAGWQLGRKFYRGLAER